MSEISTGSYPKEQALSEERLNVRLFPNILEQKSRYQDKQNISRQTVWVIRLSRPNTAGVNDMGHRSSTDRLQTDMGTSVLSCSSGAASSHNLSLERHRHTDTGREREKGELERSGERQRISP
ncbi:unnamed protein product [Pleuronectes platessa]|uniref:Uncharacterized protein n=1 Tax=Pleuronectes platessa TaxID=8262 RepID=A0A9N7VIP8_PLEPL|nr:unnamed protein product [Pleuronectes platessa]